MFWEWLFARDIAHRIDALTHQVAEHHTDLLTLRALLDSERRHGETLAEVLLLMTETCEDDALRQLGESALDAHRFRRGALDSA